MNALQKRALVADIQIARTFHKLRTGSKKRVFKRLPRQVQPNLQRRAYFALLKKTVLAAMKRLVDQKLLPRLPGLERPHQDAADDDVNSIIDALSDQTLEEYSNERIALLVQPIAQDIQRFSRQQLGKQLEAGIGVDPIRSEPYLAGMVKDFTRENVALIKSIPTQFFGDLEKDLARGIADGVRHEDLAEMIADRYGVAESRAALIARDQVGKFYGDLNKARQENVGIKGYIWRTVKDSRVREEHAEREGEHFEWDDPPEDGAPGEAINCRCVAEADVSALLDDLEAE